MNRAPLIFFGIFTALALSWAGLVLVPQFQVGAQQAKLAEGGDALYPVRRAGEAEQGQHAYVSLGCVYCHSQQVRPGDLGSDRARDWGRRRSVAQDYLYDQPVQLGSLRVGPDLATVGVRLTNEEYLLSFLFNPRASRPGTLMPGYPYLFEERKIGRTPSPDALKLSPEQGARPGYEVIPKPVARQLVAYLLSLRADAPLFEAPVPRPATNAPADTNATATADATIPADTNVTIQVTNPPSADAPTSSPPVLTPVPGPAK